jgi:5-methylcytosine-specific restriction endonuclease McrA
LCERCLAKGKYVPGDEVHHKIHLNPDNINNPEITLSWDNLELLCQSCHQSHHHRGQEDSDYSFDESGQLVYNNKSGG